MVGRLTVLTAYENYLYSIIEVLLGSIHLTLHPLILPFLTLCQGFHHLFY
jgi:hypothetical protein